MFALLAAAAIAFPGGSTNDLVHLLRESTNQDGIIVRSSAPKADLEKVEFDPASADSMNTVFRTKYDLRIVPGSEPLFSDEMIPAQLLAGVRGGGRMSPTYFQGQITYGSEGGTPGAATGRKPLTGDSFRDGKINFKTEGKETLDMSSIISAPFGKPVAMSWVFLDALPYVEIKDGTSAAFLQKLAKAVGGRFRETEKTFAIEFLPSEFRRRAERSLQAIKATDSSPESQLVAAKVKLLMGALQAMSTDDLTTVFSSPSGRVTIFMNRSNGLGGPATAYLMALENAPTQTLQVQNGPNQGGPRRGLDPARQITMALRMADPNRAAKLTFTAQFQVEIEIPLVDGNGNSAGTVKF